MDVQNRQATYSIIPTASAVIIKALNEPKRDRKKGIYQYRCIE